MNGSTVTEFVFLDFSCTRPAQLFLLTVVLTCYITILLGNTLIMVIVSSEPRLFQCPMYLFLANLSLLDMTLGSVAAPKLVTDLLNGGSTISYGGCMAQIVVFHFSGTAEMFLLSVMAYDRYVAICHPLRYTTIINQQRCFSLLVLCWTGGLIHGVFQMVIMAQLPYCGANVLDNFFCDVPQLIKLACSGIYVAEILIVVNDAVIALPSFLMLLLSYAIILAMLCGRFGKGGRKALSTCSSHLMVVVLYYGPMFFVYLKPSSNTQVDKMASVMYMVVTPALNPLIYTLRNQDMKGAMRKLRQKFLASCLIRGNEISFS
ncbi:olfactory receptor 4Q3-like [Tiliqua scincoides]|uniref:olfactory receptor 4Q3-like n=1 Tax=Tiliqua scincoides TaxID=71010 RepID=UPI0034618FD6